MRIPNQNVPESKKTAEFLESTVRAIVEACKTNFSSKKKDIECWRLYNERFNDKEFEYLTKIGDFSLPAKVRWIGVQRPKINLLVSQQTKRPFVYSVVVGDKESKRQKIYNKVDYVINVYKAKLNGEILNRNMMIYEIQKKLSDLENLIVTKTNEINSINQNMQNLSPQEQQKMMAYVQEQTAIIKELEAQLPILRMTYNEQVEEFNNQNVLTQKEIDEINKYLRMSYKEKKEFLAQYYLDKIKLKRNVEQEIIRAITNKFVTGKEYIYVDYNEGDSLPVFKCIEDIKVFYPKVDSVSKVQDSAWCAILEGYSASDIIAKYGDYLTEDDKDKIYNLENVYYNNDDDSISVNDVYYNSYSGSYPNDNILNVYKVWWKSPRRVYIKHSKNPYDENKYFRKFITEEEYNAAISKNKQSDKEKYEVRYVTDLYEGVYIDAIDKVVYAKKKKYYRGYVDDFSKVDLPIYGYTYSSVINQPYSLIRATMELQKQLNLFYYHRELMLALSGTRGVVVDKSQLPRSMSLEEHRYHKKLGNLYIETVTKGGRKINSSFNQWMQYDETLSPAIQYLDKMIQDTDFMIGMLMGITPQRIGQVVPGDQVGKTEMSIQQSSLITEILYYEHDQVIKDALEALLNMAIKYCSNEGDIIDSFDRTNGEMIYVIDKDLWKDTDLEIYIENNTIEEAYLNEAKQLIAHRVANGLVGVSDYISTYSARTLKELEKKLELIEEKEAELRQQNIEMQKQSAIEIEQRKAELLQQIEAIKLQQQKEIESAYIQLEAQKIELEKMRLGIESELKEKQMRSDTMTKMYQIESEREVEMRYLEEQNRQARFDERIRELTLKVNALFKRIELALASDKQAYDSMLKSEEIDVKRREKLTKAKEHIKD